MTNSSDLVAVMAELHAALTPGDLAQTLRRVTDAAVELLPDVDGASITVEHADGRIETAAATGSVDAGPELAGGTPELDAGTAARLDRLQQTLDEGPAIDVIDYLGPISASRAGSADDGRRTAGGAEVPLGEGVGEQTAETLDDRVARIDAGALEPGQAPAVTTSDLSRDDRYPAYGALAATAGVRAQVAVVVFDTARARGVLSLYSQRSGAFDDAAVLTDLFARHSATALAYAAEYQDRETTEVERRAIGQALGIVMGRYKLTEANAFALLQRTAEHRAISVRLVAQELVARAEGAGSQE